MLDTTADAPQSLQLLFQLPNVQGDSQNEANMASMPTQNQANPVSKFTRNFKIFGLNQLIYIRPTLSLSLSSIVV